MTSFVATSDWHIGARLRSAGPAAPRFREIRFETFRRILALAAEEEAAALFLLGDTFEGDRVGQEDVERTARLLAEAPCPVFVLPGNHDWWHPGGVIQALARAVKDVPRVRVLCEIACPLQVEGIPGVTFYPCPVLKHADVADPTAWIPPRSAEDGTRIGLIHGALERADWGGRVPERVAEVRDLDLALLGDWHKPVDGPDGRSFYCGSPEPGGFDEAHEGQVLVVRSEGEALETSRRPVGRLAWRRVDLELESTTIDGAGLQALEDAIHAVDASPEDTALRLRLRGRLSLDELQALDDRLERLRNSGWATCDVTANVEHAGEVDLSAFEEASFRAVAQRIWDGDAEAAVKRRALALLRAQVEATR